MCDKRNYTKANMIKDVQSGGIFQEQNLQEHDKRLKSHVFPYLFAINMPHKITLKSANSQRICLTSITEY